MIESLSGPYAAHYGIRKKAGAIKRIIEHSVRTQRPRGVASVNALIMSGQVSPTHAWRLQDEHVKRVID